MNIVADENLHDAAVHLLRSAQQSLTPFSLTMLPAPGCRPDGAGTIAMLSCNLATTNRCIRYGMERKNYD